MVPFFFSQNCVFFSYDVIMTSFFTIFGIFLQRMIFCISLLPVKHITSLHPSIYWPSMLFLSHPQTYFLPDFRGDFEEVKKRSLFYFQHLGRKWVPEMVQQLSLFSSVFKIREGKGFPEVVQPGPTTFPALSCF